MLLPWRTGKVIRTEDATQNTRRFWVEVPELEKFDFKPGQFVTLDLPIHEKKNKRWRSYSIASWPDGSNVFELVIVLMPQGAGSSYLFNDVEVGSELLFRGPQGIFTLPETIDKDLFLICTGTGIAPFRSMVEYIYRNNIPHKNLYLVFGCRYTKDALYFDEMSELQRKLPSFQYIPTFSRETGERPETRKGYVHNVYEEIINGNKTDAKFYLCGWKNMVDEAKERIVALGYDKKDIHLELYG
jgi:CDP-4-dehydro-6-deoxyglucose reductase